VPPLEPVGLLARCLIVVEHSLFDDEEVIGLHAFVIISDRRETTRLRSITLDVHQLGTVPELAEDLVGGRDKGCSGVIRLVSAGAIELRWMTDRLVYRQPQMRGMQNEIVSAHIDW